MSENGDVRAEVSQGQPPDGSETTPSKGVSKKIQLPQGGSTDSAISALRADAVRADIARIVDDEHTDNSPSGLLERRYNRLLQQERREPLPEDEIELNISSTNSEYQALIQAGVSPDRITSGVLTRQELRNAGFSFVNVLGLGRREKGIISGRITDPVSGEEIDLTGRILLTPGEVATVYRHQQSHPERYGLDGEDLDEVRKDMLSFVQEATVQPAFSDGKDFVERCFIYEHKLTAALPFVGEDKDWDVVKTYIKKQVKEYRKEHKKAELLEAFQAVTERIVKEKFADIYEWQEPLGTDSSFRPRTVRGHDVQSTPSRNGALSKQPSPFLDSGFVFEGNLDVNVFWDEHTDQRSTNQSRINSATIHLAGAHPDYPGFSEMGGQTDQQYMETGRYINELYSKDEAERSSVHQGERAYFERGEPRELIQRTQQRLIELARAEVSTAGSRPWHLPWRQ